MHTRFKKKKYFLHYSYFQLLYLWLISLFIFIDLESLLGETDSDNSIASNFGKATEKKPEKEKDKSIKSIAINAKREKPKKKISEDGLNHQAANSQF